MAYVNVAEWSPDQVSEWMKGLDESIAKYANSFLNNGVKGYQLLNLRADDLDHFGVESLGHQEVLLESVGYLRSFHYELDRENLQLLALRLSCAAQSLYNQLCTKGDCNYVETQTMADVANVISTIKPIVNWLDKLPFSGQTEYIDRKNELLKLSLAIATCAQRERFAEAPVVEIRNTCCHLANLADNIIQDMSDPMILQPASLDLATLKKRENELGFFILPNHQNVHQIAEIKFGSPAHTSGKIEEGDEIVQVNYQTVVGWDRKRVLSLFEESPPDVLLTLKKRPRHTKIYGQIYMKPYRLPSKKRSLPYNRWHDNLPSPRPELLTIPDFEMPLPKVVSKVIPPQLPPACSSDSDSCSSVNDSDGSPPQSLSSRVYPLKPRPVLQRRNTITGAIPFYRTPSVSIEQFWRELKIQASYKHSSSGVIQSTNDDSGNKESLMRDKSVSYGNGLELSPRPSTVIGLTPKKNSIKGRRHHGDENMPSRDRRKVGVRFKDEVLEQPLEKESIFTSEVDNALHAKNEDSLKFIDDNEDEIQDRSNLSFDERQESYEIDVKQKVISFEEKSKQSLEKPVPKTRTIYKLSENVVGQVSDHKFRKPPDIPPKPSSFKKPAVPPRNLDRIGRGRLDKSHSTPAYDTSESSDYSVQKLDNSIASVASCSNETVHDEVLIVKMGEISDTISISLHNYRQREQENRVEESRDPYEMFVPRMSDGSPSVYPKKQRNTSISIMDCAPVPPPRPTHTFPSESPKHKISLTFPTSIKESELSQIYNTPEPPKVTKKSEVIETKLKVNTSSRPDKSETKISTPNAVRAIISSKGKGVKKKNSLLQKRRKVSVKDVSPGEIQGFLYQRDRNKTTQNVNWIKRWFVLNGSALYGFKAKDATKAECVIFLTEFTVSLANEVKSRAHAFKVYHTGTAIYLSADNAEIMSTWVDLISSAITSSDDKANDSNLYSETDDSGDEDNNPKKSQDKSQQSTPRKFGSLKKFTSKKHSDTSNPSDSPGSTSLDRKYLRFFNSHSSTKQPKTQNLPVPTAQFRSYRKVVPPTEEVKKPDLLHNTPEETRTKVTKATLQKPKPINYIHASNPSLCDFTDFKIPVPFLAKPKGLLHRNDNLTGCITLEQFMLKRQEEERKQNAHLYPPESPVIIVEEPVELVEHKKLGESHSFPYKSEKNTLCRKYSDGAPTDKHLELKNIAPSRSLPRNDSRKMSTDSVFDDELDWDISYVCGKSKSKKPHPPTPKHKNKIVRQHSLNSADKKLFETSKLFNRGDSPEKFRLNSLRRNDKVFHSSTPNPKDKLKLKSATQYTPINYSFSNEQKLTNAKFAFELNLDEKTPSSSKTSSKLKNLFSSNSHKTDSEKHKEKTLLGSPRLHRAIFSRRNNSPPTVETDWRGEFNSAQVSPPFLQTSTTNPVSSLTHPCSSPPYTQSTQSASIVSTQTVTVHHQTQPDYPGLEYPPVFEPETYSLSNPASSLLRKTKQNVPNK